VTNLPLVRRIAARPSIVFASLITAEGIAGWWGAEADSVVVARHDPRVGGGYSVRLRRPNGSHHASAGEYLVVEPPRRLVMTWRWLEGGDDLGERRLEFRLRPLPGGVELTLTHSASQGCISARRIGDMSAQTY
jgi:uncharacterized protein YndB with AHSA1/START domain